MGFTPGNSIQSRDGTLYTEAYTSANALPADSAAQTSPGGSWVDKGGIEGGVDVRFAFTYTDGHVDQSIWPIFTVGTAGDMHLIASLAEATVQNLQQALGQGTLSALAAGSGTYGHNDLTIDTTVAVTFLSALYQLKNSTGDGQDIRILIRKALAKGSPQPKFVGTAMALLALDLQAYPDSANSNQLMIWRDIATPLP